jgi:large exoprotein involved in heme utilization and adhesion
MGSLNANGQVFVLNPNGVLFGPNASVNVGGLVASTLDMDSKSFVNGSQVLEGGGAGAVVNQGRITASQGGYVALVGPRVVNEGAISAVQGKVLMAAGDKVSLTLGNGSLAGYSIDRGSLDALVQNSGFISASGGEVTLTASAVEQIGRAAVNHTGVIEAQTVEDRPGTIRLLGDMKAGTLQVTGKLDASAPNGGKGGFVETSAAQVNIADSGQVTTFASSGKTGTWLIDPDDFEIKSGEAAGTTSSIGATTLSTNLGKTNVQIVTANVSTGTGDLYVNAAVKWDAATKLTLSASRNIYINADINATKGQLQLEYAQSGSSPDYGYFLNNGAKVFLPDGGNFFVSPGKGFGLVSYRVISKLGGQGSATENDLQGISNNVIRYVLGADIDASATYRWDGDKGDGGFVPISGFAGTLDGLGHTISNLYINNTKQQYVGLFGDLKPTGNIRNLVLENANVSNRALISTVPVGSVVGQNEGKLFNVHTRNMTVSTSTDNAGGLVGNNKGEIRNSSAVGAVNVLIAKEEIEGVGGLVGTQSGTIIDSYAMAAVNGRTSTGGLVGLMTGGSVSGSYAGKSTDGYGSVVGGENTGGLIGYMKSGTVSNSYAAVPVTGANGTGGLIGRAAIESKVENTYATGLVKFTGDDDKAVGGLVGSGGATVTTSFWDMQTTGQAQANSNSGLGLASSEMKNLAIFAGKGWSVDDEGGTGKVWRIYDGQTAPLLRSFLVMKEVEANSVIYNAQTQAGCTGTPCGSAAGDLPFTAASGLNAGTYAPYSTQQGYDIKGGKLTITPKTVTFTASAENKVYDGTNVAVGTLTGDFLGADKALITVTQRAMFDNENAQKGKTVSFSNANLLGTGASNYQISGTLPTATADITARPVTFSNASAENKVYDGTKVAVGTLTGDFLEADKARITVTPNAAFKDENVGTGKAVFFSPELTGAGAGNYQISGTLPAAAANITAKLVTFTATAENKVYDGTKVAVGTLTGDFLDADKDRITVTSNAAFKDENVGTGKPVSFSPELTGTGASNYQISGTLPTAAANITARPVTFSNASAGNKVYDGTNVAVGTLTGDFLDADKARITVTPNAAFKDENAEIGKAVFFSPELTGTGASNYQISGTLPTATADITPRPVTFSNASAGNKVYDGTKAAFGTLADNLLEADKKRITVTPNATFKDENVGTGKAVFFSPELTGTGAGNYQISGTLPAAAANISPKELTLSGVTVLDKIYDGNTSAAVNDIGILRGILRNDVVNVDRQNISVMFADKNVGDDKVVAVSKLGLSGTDAANYTLVDGLAAKGSIRPRQLVVAASGVDKVYDADTSATVALNDNRIPGDSLSLSYAKASFADSNAGSGKTVTVADIAASGIDAGNYLVDPSAVTTVGISKAPLTVTANPDNKTFDGKVYRGGNGVAYTGFIAGENAAVLSGQPSYGGDAQGAVNVGSYRIASAGYASQNYAIVYVDGKLTVQPPPAEPVYQAAGTAVAATAVAMNEASSKPDGARPLQQHATLRITGCGTRIPERLEVVVDCNEERVPTNVSGSVVPATGL